LSNKVPKWLADRERLIMVSKVGNKNENITKFILYYDPNFPKIIWENNLGEPNQEITFMLH